VLQRRGADLAGQPRLFPCMYECIIHVAGRMGGMMGLGLSVLLAG
jgi:hypothetical protein